MFLDSALLRSAPLQPVAEADQSNFGRLVASCQGCDLDEPIARPHVQCYSEKLSAKNMAISLLPFIETSWVMDRRLEIARQLHESLGKNRPS